MSDMLTILCGDALDQLRTLPAESVQCVVTSPPYWGLRDYGVDGQIGLEESLPEFLAKLCGVFEEVRRVLRKDGTLWLNMGDCYASGGNGGGRSGQRDFPTSGPERGGCTSWTSREDKGGARKGFKAKDLVGQPWRLALALQDAGWYLRSDIIWAKPNPMPESVRDRPTRAHEYIFLLSKSPRYYYNADAIRTPPRADTIPPLKGADMPNPSKGKARIIEHARRRVKVPGGWDVTKGEGGHGTINKDGRTRGVYKAEKQRGHAREHTGFNDHWDKMNKTEQQQLGANSRTVWSIATKGYHGAHFATFPEELPRRCILAGSRPGDVVLDPFGGSGTTAYVALGMGRRAVTIELNPEYVEMIRKRCEGMQLGLC